MKISRDNYESFFIDYLDGKLDENMIDDFLEFLQQNPDLKEELSFFENISLEKEEISFDKKEALLKERFDSEKEFNEAAIAELEGEITAEEKKEFDTYLATHPEKQKDIELFKLTKLQAETSIKFNKKHKIRKQSKRKTLVLWTSRAAAVLLLAISVYIFINNSSKQYISDNKIAEVSKEETNTNDKKPEEIALPPQQEEKKPIDSKIKKETKKPVLKKVEPKNEPNKSLRENTKGRLEKDDFASNRSGVKIPVQLASLNPVVYSGIENPELAQVSYYHIEVVEEIPEEKFFVDRFRKKANVDIIKVDKIRDASLDAVTNISKEKFLFKKNENGKVTEINYDSGFLAFSIPMGKKAKRNTP